MALGAYDGLIRRLVLDAKRPAGEDGAMALGRLLAERRRQQLLGCGETLVVPVPQHWRRRLSRRADGVGALARSIAGELRRPYAPALTRVRATPRQTDVAPSDRSANVRRAFRARRRRRLSGICVLLVDDVLTTGATCHAAALALKRAGATRVVAVVAARRLATR
ncbi:phosphoribosyltransferase family protein [Botrimarina sp.]|uniref:ComF family protein n=1 Tax=Botrimarina sp. TaxID=2795802 RepID=UPI0032EFA556